MQQKDSPENNKDSSVLGELKTTVSLIKAVPWGAIWKRVQILFSARMTIIGPEASGKSTLVQVLYNAGNLVEITDHRRTPQIFGEGALEVTFTGPTGESNLLLRSIWDTPGQRHDTASDVARHIASYKPRVLVFVLDMARPFSLPPDQAELDTEKWFDDLIVYAEGKEGREFCESLGLVDCVVVMLNKINKVYDGLFDKFEHDRPGKIDNILKEQKDAYEEKVVKKIQSLFSKARRNITRNDISFIGCCLVRYDKKKSAEFDSGHVDMLEIVNHRLRRRRNG